MIKVWDRTEIRIDRALEAFRAQFGLYAFKYRVKGIKISEEKGDLRSFGSDN